MTRMKETKVGTSKKIEMVQEEVTETDVPKAYGASEPNPTVLKPTIVAKEKKMTMDQEQVVGQPGGTEKN